MVRSDGRQRAEDRAGEAGEAGAGSLQVLALGSFPRIAPAEPQPRCPMIGAPAG